MTYASMVKLAICFHESWSQNEDGFVIWVPGWIIRPTLERKCVIGGLPSACARTCWGQFIYIRMPHRQQWQEFVYGKMQWPGTSICTELMRQCWASEYWSYWNTLTHSYTYTQDRETGQNYGGPEVQNITAIYKWNISVIWLDFLKRLVFSEMLGFL